MKQVAASEFKHLLLKPTHWIDVRAPIEFQTGAIPGAVNLPLLTDAERHEIGLIYKTKGQQAAIELGHHFVSGPVRESRVARWLAEIKIHPDSVIYCFRGGLRSQIVQSWLEEAGCHCPIVTGGYKALRQFLLATLVTATEALEFHVVSGPTGSGKTDYIKSSGRPYVDLEALAIHRGSAFGAFSESQPRQSNFENALAVELLGFLDGGEPVLIEDESRQIGFLSIPPVLFYKMQTSHKIILEVPIDTRVENIFKDYVLSSCLGPESGAAKFAEFRSSVQAISRKLGGARTQEILLDLDTSQKEFASGKGFSSNRVWIRKLLEWYYDPSYKFANERR